MASPLSGMFAMPEQQPSRMQRLGTALMGFGAGVQGRGQEHAMAVQQQQQTLELNRQKAMAQDAMQVYNLLGSGRYDQAIDLIDKRVKNISELGGDPSDTLEIRQLITSGQVPVAVQELEGFLGQAMQYGLIDPPQAPEFLEMRDGQAIMKNPDGSISAQVPRGYTPPEAGSGANMGLSPVWLQNEQGQYVPAQLSDAGGMILLEVPQGMRAIPPSGQLGFDPNAIATRGAALTDAEVQNIAATTPGRADQAGAITAAQNEANIAAVAPMSEAERAAALEASKGPRQAALESKFDQFELMDDLMTQARDLSSAWSTGFIGGASSLVAGTPAYNLSRTLDTLKAIAGFDTLVELKSQGGTLGAVSEQELALLQAVWGSLEQAQSKEQFERAITRFDTQVKRSWDRVTSAYERDYGEPFQSRRTPSGQSEVPAQYSDVITPDIWRRMTPEQRAAFQ